MSKPLAGSEAAPWGRADLRALTATLMAIYGQAVPDAKAATAGLDERAVAARNRANLRAFQLRNQSVECDLLIEFDGGEDDLARITDESGGRPIRIVARVNGIFAVRVQATYLMQQLASQMERRAAGAVRGRRRQPSWPGGGRRGEAPIAGPRRSHQQRHRRRRATRASTRKGGRPGRIGRWWSGRTRRTPLPRRYNVRLRARRRTAARRSGRSGRQAQSQSEESRDCSTPSPRPAERRPPWSGRGRRSTDRRFWAMSRHAGKARMPAPTCSRV